MKKQKIIIALLIIATIGLFGFAHKAKLNITSQSNCGTIEFIGERNGCRLYFTDCHSRHTYWSVCTGATSSSITSQP